MDSTASLNFNTALRNVHIDILGDWYRDPWSWPEYEYCRTENWHSAVLRARSSGIRRVTPLNVPKENFGIRPAIVMDPLDRLLYQALVDHASRQLIGELDPWVFGWRLPRRDLRVARYAPNKTEWRLYRGRLSRLAVDNPCGLKTDVVACFASVPVSRVIEDIERLAGPSKITDRLSDMLAAFDMVPRRGGLPERSKASSTLANMYLRRLDRVLRGHDEKGAGEPLALSFGGYGGTLRWMDDMWVFGTDEANLRSAQIEIDAAARDAALKLNLAKTAVMCGEELLAVARRIQHSAVDAALDHEPPECMPLEGLIDSLLANPEHADQSSIRFAMHRMRRHKLQSRRDNIVAAAARMPHGAAHISRVFRDFGWWGDLQDWYLEYQGGPWGIFDLSIANFGAMFPSGQKMPTHLQRHMAAKLVARPSLPLFALAAQRLASWRPALARDAIRAVLPQADHPHERRILGLAALLAREERGFIRSVLGEYEENAVTLDMIEARSFKAIEPSPDFAADDDER